MTKNKALVIFSVIMWLIVCQLFFMPIQSSIGQRVADSVQNQLRQELDFSDFHYISRSIADFNKSGAISCPVLNKVYPTALEILDLRYMSESCSNTDFLLNGVIFKTQLKSLNGDIYDFQYISKNPSLFYTALWAFRIIGVLIVLLMIQLLKLQRQKNDLAIKSEKEIAQAKENLSQKLAHDIRSPISTLGLISVKILDPEIRELQLSVVKQINEIANKLLQDVRTEKIGFNILSTSESKELKNLSVFFSDLQKEYKFKSIALKQIVIFNITEASSTFKVSVGLTKILYPILNNLIQNSIDATDNNGVIKISSEIRLGKLFISVEDNGKGIPENILKELGIKAISYGKEKNDNLSGNGIAVYNAKKDLEAFGCELHISSKLGQGTQIEIIIP